MTQLSFSHKFPHRWLAAPQPVKDAIVQELDDIVTLLDNDTDLNSFEFSTPNLTDYIKACYEKSAEEATAKAQEEVSDGEPPATDLPVTDKKIADSENRVVKIENTTGDVKLLAANKDQTTGQTVSQLSNQAEHQSSQSVSKMHDEALTHKDSPTITIKTTETETTDTTSSNSNSQNETTKTETKLHSDAAQAATPPFDDKFISELETRIDDYLTEQMTQMSEDVKSWLRNEIKQYREDN